MELEDPRGPDDPTAAALHHTLLGFYLDMTRGMAEFRRAYALAPPGDPQPLPDAASLRARLTAVPRDAEAWNELQQGLQDLKVHHAALLEGYQEAAQAGSRRLLDSLDPNELRKEFEGSRVRIGPLNLTCRGGPLLLQAIWEELLRRFRQYQALDAAQFERFYRDGFQRGYRRFFEARSGRAPDRRTVEVRPGGEA